MQNNPHTHADASRTGQPAATHSAIDNAHRIVNVCAVAIRNKDGLVLTVRKKSSDGFMMPGGKPELGESPVQTACREVSEEIGLTPDPTRMHYLGTLEAAALNESGFTVRAETFEYASLSPHAEIAELRWVDPAMTRPSDVAAQAPLNTEQIFPLLAATPAPRD